VPRKKKLSTEVICAELTQLKAETVEIRNIYLDPNNPRLAYPGKRKVPDNEIPKPEVQQYCAQQIKVRYGIKDLTESIENSGFSIVDRIVVRRLKQKNLEGKFVVVEGNRRVLALQTLLEGHRNRSHPLLEEVVKTIVSFEALIYPGTNTMIAWIIQGFRHTLGIKQWDRYPQAQFLAEFATESGKEIKKIPRIFGMNPKKVMHLIRSYYGFEDAKKDPDYGEYLEPKHFGHFDEIIFEKDVIGETWLGWKDKGRCFTNKDNLNLYLSWVLNEEEKPNITISPVTRDALAFLLEPGNEEYFEEFKNGLITVEQCFEQFVKAKVSRFPKEIPSIIREIENTISLIKVLPLPEIQNAKKPEDVGKKNKLVKLLLDLSKIARQQIKNIVGR